MIRYLPLAAALALAAPAAAQDDELAPVPTQVLLGHAYLGDLAPSRLRFVNVRPRAVSINWIAFDGSERPYGVIAPGEELVQSTYVAHRWMVRDARDGSPLSAFISTRSAARDDGAAQIALIR